MFEKVEKMFVNEMQTATVMGEMMDNWIIFLPISEV